MASASQCLRLSSGDQVPVTPFQPPNDGFGVALLSLELDYVSKRRATAAEYDAKTLAKHILARYIGQARTCSAIGHSALPGWGPLLCSLGSAH